jgi:hypothetical protein
MATLFILTFFFWLMSASMIALNIALPKAQPVKIRARRSRQYRQIY